ncbi:MAG: AAA family ATPase [Magnetococcales bacterium]|nr:AAA family ATPase [Magnetococcales bacterium]
MLLRFSVKNLFCFADEAEFSMVATKDKNHPEHLCPADKFKALRISALYGANAHGKSRLVQAMQRAKEIITKGTEPGQTIPVKPFLLDRNLREQPSRFEFKFTFQEVIHTYGFVCDEKRIHEEWLFSQPFNQREVRLFERRTDVSGTSEFRMGRTLARSPTKNRNFLRFLMEGVRSNQLFLFHAVNLNLNAFDPVFKWFKYHLFAWSPDLLRHDTSLTPIPLYAHKDEHFCNFAGKFLQDSDTGINSIKVIEKDGDLDPFLQFLIANQEIQPKDGLLSIKNQHEKDENFFVPSPDKKPRKIEILAIHQTKDGETVPFDMNEESAGTRRLLELLPLLHDTNNEERVFIIDELDRTLHPSLSRSFIKTFLDIGNCNKNQLIFTTHESNLLDLDLLRRDEIWFVEKDEAGKSHVYPLTSFKARPDINIARGYLQGRFGAIPFFNHSSTLGQP